MFFSCEGNFDLEECQEIKHTQLPSELISIVSGKGFNVNFVVTYKGSFHRLRNPAPLNGRRTFQLSPACAYPLELRPSDPPTSTAQTPTASHIVAQQLGHAVDANGHAMIDGRRGPIGPLAR